MTTSNLEHVNLTVTNPVATAELLIKLFGWKIRWQGQSRDIGYTVHVGSETSYLALYAEGNPKHGKEHTYTHIGGLNHIGVVVDDLDATETRILAAGLKTTIHSDYEPGRRFYFENEDGIEFEVICYD